MSGMRGCGWILIRALVATLLMAGAAHGIRSHAAEVSLTAGQSAWLAAHGRMSPTEFKEISGLPRRTAIPLLEWFDATGLTRREGDERVVGPRT